MSDFILYKYFGNTSLRVADILYNFEMQILIFEELFANSDKCDDWKDDSVLQMKYELKLREYGLLNSSDETKKFGTKDARVKSSPLEYFGLIDRKNKKITQNGHEFLQLLNSEAFKKQNKLLEIDLISLFFVKSLLNSNKYSNLFLKYLDIFYIKNGVMSWDEFLLLPLICNFKDESEFLFWSKMANFSEFYHKDLERFLSDFNDGKFKGEYFKTAKGDKQNEKIYQILENVFCKFRTSRDETILRDFLNTKQEPEREFKKKYLKFIVKNKILDVNLEQNLAELKHFTLSENFATNFYTLIRNERINSNLKDYGDLNRRYLNLTGLFEFENNEVKLNSVFLEILRSNRRNEILEIIKNEVVSENLLSEFESDFQKQTQNLKNSKFEKLKKLLENKFTKSRVLEILHLFSNRQNDKKINEMVNDARIPTIFEYMVALSWVYITNEPHRLFEAGLSLDTDLLPKSHAVGGGADMAFDFGDHSLMVEATLTEKSTQRRAEMESVSRHLGTMILAEMASGNVDKASATYGIFLAPYLDRNVLNDFRARLWTHFENDKFALSGMQILPLCTDDLVCILVSNLSYKDFWQLCFREVLASKDIWGSRWYEHEVHPKVRRFGGQSYV